MLDAATKELLGWAFADHMRTELAHSVVLVNGSVNNFCAGGATTGVVGVGVVNSNDGHPGCGAEGTL